jgi:hypothetical protein
MTTLMKPRMNRNVNFRNLVMENMKALTKRSFLQTFQKRKLCSPMMMHNVFDRNSQGELQYCAQYRKYLDGTYQRWKIDHCRSENEAVLHRKCTVRYYSV